MSFDDFISVSRTRIEKILEQTLPTALQEPIRLHAAMRYAVLNGGKRLRPIIVYAAASSLRLPFEYCDKAACAIELVHAYSLIHDDLPAMDNDDLRRGLPTCHKAFDEATAILAGDALQTLAFALLTECEQLHATQRLTMVHELASACGSLGMAGGQSLDLAATKQMISLSELRTIHQLKTGCLIRTCVRFAAIAADIQDLTQLQALDEYANCLGLAFQIQDDILDVEASTATLGKTQGADLALGKSTYPTLLGLTIAKQHMQQLYEQASHALNGISLQASYLQELIVYLQQRTH